jgi:hypothetical protein
MVIRLHHGRMEIRLNLLQRLSGHLLRDYTIPKPEPATVKIPSSLTAPFVMTV